MNEEQEWFLGHYLNYINNNYPVRYKAGVQKYGSILHKDYSAISLADNALEELQDGVAYLLALKIQLFKLIGENDELKEKNASLSEEIKLLRKNNG